MRSNGRNLAAVVAAAGATLVGLAPAASAAGSAATSGPVIHVLSNRADVISAGDALVAIDNTTATTKIRLNGTDIHRAFTHLKNGRIEGLITGLKLGANTLTADRATVTIVDHPNGGPVFTGPQIQPWVCQSGAKDAQCNQPATITWSYKSTSGQFMTYDPAKPPTDVATVTTQTGETVPYIVRKETGYQDRDQYAFAVVYQPGKPWTAWAPQKQFAHKMLITHGASCGIDHQSASAADVMSDPALSRGFVVMSTALNNAGHNCNIATQAESMIMAKERVIEQLGTLRFTIGTGCSGGSLTQQQVANAYPGLYQGILPQCSFPDAWSTGQQLAAYNLLRRYLENPTLWAPGVVWDPLTIGLVEGHPNHVNSIVFDTVYWTSLGVPDDGCPGVDAAQTYNAQTNPGGVRCDLADYMINVQGPRPERIWSPMEKKVGHGFGDLPLSDVGVQFGLLPLMKGLIRPAQFVDLNAKIGGVDVDIKHTDGRVDATPESLRNVYRSGGVNSTNNEKGLAIIDLRGPDPGAFHDAYRSWAVRARLEREEGHFPKNHVIWFGAVPLMGDPNWTTDGLIAMDKWLEAVEKDTSSKTLEQKVADDRPSSIGDRCFNVDGVEAVDVPGIGPVCKLDAVQTRFSTPAVQAGESIATDTNRCQLKPLSQSDYYPITFTAAQWTQLQAAFPTGVCDWSRPGVQQQGAIPWQTYQDASGNVVYGGKPLGRAPANTGTGWTSDAFASWLDAKKG